VSSGAVQFNIENMLRFAILRNSIKPKVNSSHRKTSSVYNLLAIILFCTSIHTSQAQTISGVVNNTASSPIANAHVIIKGMPSGTITNNKGEFLLPVQSGANLHDTLIISHVSYQTRVLSVAMLNDAKNIVVLQESSRQIPEAVVLPNKSLKRRLKFDRLAELKKGINNFGAIMLGDSIYIIGGDASIIDHSAKRAFARMADAQPGNQSGMQVKPSKTWEQYLGDLQVYDMVNDTCRLIEGKFSPRAFHAIHSCLGQLYVIGGKRISTNKMIEYLANDIEVLSLSNDTIRIDQTNPHQAINFTSCIFKNNLIIFGGSVSRSANGQKSYTNKVHMYHIPDGLWYELNPMPIAMETKGILLAENMYFFGGEKISALKTIFSYNLLTGEWQSLGRLPSALTRPAITSHNKVLYIFEDRTFYTYNTVSKKLKRYEIGLSIMGAEMFCKDERVIIIGGYKSDEFSLKPSKGIYSIALGEFSNTQVMESFTLYHKTLITQ
jgi:hypothetical protein